MEHYSDSSDTCLSYPKTFFVFAQFVRIHTVRVVLAGRRKYRFHSDYEYSNIQPYKQLRRRISRLDKIV